MFDRLGAFAGRALPVATSEFLVNGLIALYTLAGAAVALIGTSTLARRAAAGKPVGADDVEVQVAKEVT